MAVYVRFLFDFMNQFFGGILDAFVGIGKGFMKMINIPEYIRILKGYSIEFTFGQWVLVGLTILVALSLIGVIIFLIVLIFRKYVRVRKSLVEQETLLEEIGKLNRDVLKLTQEKERLYAMKVSQLGLKPGESDEIEVELDENGNPIENKDGEEQVDENASRFYKLTQIDKEMETNPPAPVENNFTLEELCDTFRNYAASKMQLYYKIKVIRLFIASFASSRLIILQGISGTGKTSLPYAFGKFIKNDSTIASVQPSWRDRTELFGYFNEFTKRFNETEVLSKMYEASYTDIVYLTILDEMNIARVEYYFAEMLSILEMPSRDEWIIDLVPSVWPSDPKKLTDGKLKI
ncbi:MAG: hypothetical protein PHO63_05915, partial [Bacilli bacterium]|nr:hypothetical protein [Bacilli bacterium]